MRKRFLTPFLMSANVIGGRTTSLSKQSLRTCNVDNELRQALALLRCPPILADWRYQQGGRHKCRCVALWPCYFSPGHKSCASKPLRSPSNRASVALLLGYLALSLGHPG